MRDEYQLVVRPFRMHGDTDKQAALKPLEEAAEVFGAYQDYSNVLCETYLDADLHVRTVIDPEMESKYKSKHENLADEIADCIQACCNLAAKYNIDLWEAMHRCMLRNRERGRYE